LFVLKLQFLHFTIVVPKITNSGHVFQILTFQ
jgi:hypothetical protein